MSKCILAGVGRADIRYSSDCFPTFREGYTGVHDAPSVHIFYFSGAADYAIAALDQVNVKDWDAMRRFVGQQLNLPQEHVLYHVNHTLSCPHDFEGDGFQKSREALANAVHQALQEACVQAKAALQPARIGCGTAYSTVNVSRVIELAEGWWQGRNESGPSDHNVQILRIDTLQGEPMGILYFVNTAPGALEGSRGRNGERLISGDIASAANRQIEAFLPGAKAAYILGASADQWVRFRAVFDLITPKRSLVTEDLHEDGFLLAELQGRQLGSIVAAAAMEIPTVPIAQISLFQKKFVYSGQKELGRSPGSMQPCRTLPFTPAADVSTPMTVMVINDIALLCHTAEVTTRTVQEIRKRSPYKATCFMAFTNGASGYMVSHDLYEKCSMQCRKSIYAAGSAEQYVENAVQYLNTLYRSGGQSG